jgi:hypothetical protein
MMRTIELMPTKLAGSPAERTMRSVPLRYPSSEVPPVTKVRSTLVASSLRAITDTDRFAEYQELLPSQLHPIVLGALAGSWLDIDAVVEHYRAMDSLGLEVPEQVSLGEAVGSTVRTYLIGNAARVAPAVDATPWSILPHTQRTWDRLYVGGDVGIEESGPQQFIRTIYGLPLCKIPYFRHASRGIMRSVVSRWCASCEVTELACTANTLRWQVSWT